MWIVLSTWPVICSFRTRYGILSLVPFKQKLFLSFSLHSCFTIPSIACLRAFRVKLDVLLFLTIAGYTAQTDIYNIVRVFWALILRKCRTPWATLPPPRLTSSLYTLIQNIIPSHLQIWKHYYYAFGNKWRGRSNSRWQMKVEYTLIVDLSTFRGIQQYVDSHCYPNWVSSLGS